MLQVPTLRQNCLLRFQSIGDHSIQLLFSISPSFFYSSSSSSASFSPSSPSFKTNLKAKSNKTTTLSRGQRFLCSSLHAYENFRMIRHERQALRQTVAIWFTFEHHQRQLVRCRRRRVFCSNQARPMLVLVQIMSSKSSCD